MTKKITVGFDGSALSQAAVTWAANEAAALGVSVEVVQCYPDTASSVAASFNVAALDAAGEVARDAAFAAARLVRDAFPGLDVRGVSACGSPAYALLDGVGDDGLVVLGGSARHGALAKILGTTPRTVARRAPCPVVVVNGEVPGPPRRIVVGVDGSPSSAAALSWAADEADLHRIRLVVVHAWQYPYTYVRDMEPTAVHDVMRVAAGIVLEESVELAQQRCGADVDCMLVERSPASALVHAVREGDLLVVGSGRPAGSGLLGSIANRVLDEADVPVAVIPA